MIDRPGHIVDLFQTVKDIHPETRWDIVEGNPYMLSIQVPASFDVHEFMAGMSALLGPADAS